MRLIALSVGILLLVACADAGQSRADVATESPVPSLSPDSTWPADLPAHWVFGPGTGLYVDGRDHAWILHRPERVTDEDMAAAFDATIEDCCERAPPLIELDPAGRVLRTFGTIERSEDWPYFPHGVFVEDDGSFWVGNAPHHTIMKFSRDGTRLLTLGTFDRTGGSDDPALLGGAADFWLDPETNELFVADGYDNRRIVVFDGDSGAYLRQWGAYGEPADDAYVFDSTAAEPSSQFNLVHGITGSEDGLLYVADATTSRIQVFEKDGTFVAERSIDGRSLPGRITDVALSPDPEQTWLFVSDGRDDKIWILRRADLEIVGQFGRSGSGWGEFGRPHNVTTDSRGNVYVAEAHPGRRFQRFLVQDPPS